MLENSTLEAQGIVLDKSVMKSRYLKALNESGASRIISEKRMSA
jgi:hypothetical protein